ncbi:hypothetical protein CGMCC3_g17793 [Colletotrichum fructicola]|nr:uncharacterized protein CGMCC3_g17793 [Colletotrichum fructicola]KAE9566031.1 hypothetical protein CGMCC3_g17793 [Colletotrichum fructicola]
MPDRNRALEELRAARQVCEAAQSKRKLAKAKVLDKENNFKQAREEGNIAECGCCFDECPLDCMVHCNAPDSEHRALFLDDKLQAALDRIEFGAALQAQGFENLSACPFFPYAADCPPIEEDKEFRCINPECEIVSCRLCKQETHVPRTCEEAAAENGISARRKLEEAMSAALIRKCNKCNTPFIREAGCNKMTCARPGCRNVQCQSCDYSHFDDSSRGGQEGKLPSLRGDRANPEFNEEHLTFNTSKRVPDKQKNRRSAQLREAPRGARR